MGSIPHSNKYDSVNKNKNRNFKPVNKNSDNSSSKIYQSNNDYSFANKFKIENREDFIAKSLIIGSIAGGVIGALIGSENEIIIGAIIGAITIGSIILYIANKKK